MFEGPDRRSNKEDHDLLKEIANDLKHLVNSMNNHLEDDKVAFKELNTKISGLYRYVWILVGAIAILEFISKMGGIYGRN